MATINCSPSRILLYSATLNSSSALDVDGDWKHCPGGTDWTFSIVILNSTVQTAGAETLFVTIESTPNLEEIESDDLIHNVDETAAALNLSTSDGELMLAPGEGGVGTGLYVFKHIRANRVLSGALDDVPVVETVDVEIWAHYKRSSPW